MPIELLIEIDMLVAHLWDPYLLHCVHYLEIIGRHLLNFNIERWFCMNPFCRHDLDVQMNKIAFAMMQVRPFLHTKTWWRSRNSEKKHWNNKLILWRNFGHYYLSSGYWINTCEIIINNLRIKNIVVAVTTREPGIISTSTSSSPVVKKPIVAHSTKAGSLAGCNPRSIID